MRSIKQILLTILIAYGINWTDNITADPTISPIIPYLMAVSVSTLAMWKWQARRLERHKINKQQELDNTDKILTIPNDQVQNDTSDISNIFRQYGAKVYGRYADPFKNIEPIISEYLGTNDTIEEDGTSESDQKSAHSQHLVQKLAHMQQIDSALEVSSTILIAATIGRTEDYTYDHSISIARAKSMVESLRSLADINEEVGQHTPLIQKYFVNPFEDINQVNLQQMETNQINRKYQKKLRTQRKFITSPLYSMMRYIALPLGLCIGISSLFRDDQAIPRSADPFWHTLLCTSGLFCTITELPACLLRYRIRQQRKNTSAHTTNAQILAKSRVHQGFLDLTCGLGIALAFGAYVEIAKSSSFDHTTTDYVVGSWLGTSWLALQAAYSLFHIL